MEFIQTDIPDVIQIIPKQFGDSRGFFLETYRLDLFSKMGIPWCLCAGQPLRLPAGRASRTPLSDSAGTGQAGARHCRGDIRRCGGHPSQFPDIREMGGARIVCRKKAPIMDSARLRPRILRAE